jgi:leucyl/phenylalanyl-tRNA--protein transferase
MRLQKNYINAITFRIFAAVFLNPELLLQAYVSGAFPMAHPEHDNAIYWHTPAIRGIIPLDNQFKIPKNLHRLYRTQKYKFTINHNFKQVINACAAQRVTDTWISDEIIDAYCQLNQLGYAHSFETRLNGKLVGGLYGVAIGKAFFGESMFFIEPNTSKLALVFLVEFLREQAFKLLDTQYLNPHLLQFGAFEITHEEYMDRLKEAVEI